MPMSDYMRRLRARIGNDLVQIPSVTILTFDDQQRVLLVMHADVRRWTTPGGAVEPRERPADAAVREMWEETGLDVELVGVLGVFGGPEFTTTYSNGDVVSFTTTVFEGRVRGGTARPDLSETLAVCWFTREEVGVLDADPWVRQIVMPAFARRAPAYFAPPTWRPPAR